MFSIEALLTVPLSLSIFIQAILYIKPVQVRMEKQTCIVAQERISLEKNQKIYAFDKERAITHLQVNPQKTCELVYLAQDISFLLTKSNAK